MDCCPNRFSEVSVNRAVAVPGHTYPVRKKWSHAAAKRCNAAQDTMMGHQRCPGCGCRELYPAGHPPFSDMPKQDHHVLNGCRQILLDLCITNGVRLDILTFDEPIAGVEF